MYNTYYGSSLVSLFNLVTIIEATNVAVLNFIIAVSEASDM